MLLRSQMDYNSIKSQKNTLEKTDSPSDFFNYHHKNYFCIAIISLTGKR